MLCLQFYMKKPFKIYWTHLQFLREIPLLFVQKKKSTLKFFLKFTWKSLYKIFLKKNPLKFFLKKQGKSFGKKFLKKNPCKFFSKKITFEIWPQKYPLGSTSWTPFFQKLSPPECFWKFLGQLPNLSRTSFPLENCCALFYTNVVVTHNPPFNISEIEKK